MNRHLFCIYKFLTKTTSLFFKLAKQLVLNRLLGSEFFVAPVAWDCSLFAVLYMFLIWASLHLLSAPLTIYFLEPALFGVSIVVVFSNLFITSLKLTSHFHISTHIHMRLFILETILNMTVLAFPRSHLTLLIFMLVYQFSLHFFFAKSADHIHLRADFYNVTCNLCDCLLLSAIRAFNL